MPILYAALAGTATLLGLALTLYAKNWVKKYSFYLVSLAAGVLLGTAFFHLLPEANELIQDDLFLWVLGGFVLFFVIEALIGFHACREGEEHNHHHVLGPVAGLGIFLHSLLDGLAIGIGFEIDPTLGLVTALAVMLHELPEGIFTFSLLAHAKVSTKKAVLWSIAVALATPAGAVLGLLFLPDMHEAQLGYLLALTAGSFLYIAAADLVPESHKSRSLSVSVFMLLGLVLMYMFNSVVPHGHEEEYDQEHEEEYHEEDTNHLETNEYKLH